MFELKYVRTEQKQMSLSIHGVKIWNSIDEDIKTCKSIHIFKSKYKTHLLSQYWQFHSRILNSLQCPCSFFVIYVHFECMTSSVKNAFKNTLWLKAVQMWQLQIIFHTHTYEQMVLILFFSFCFSIITLLEGFEIPLVMMLMDKRVSIT